MRKSIFLLIAFILIIPIVFSGTTYNKTGTEDSFYQGGNGLFNTVNTIPAAFSQTITSTNNPLPAITDMNGDGINEIIIIDGVNFEIWRANVADRVFELQSIFVMKTSSTPYDVAYMFDIDGDGLTEAIVASTADIHIIEYNGSVTINTTSHRAPFIETNNEIMVSCRGVNDCIALVTSNNGNDLRNPYWFDNQTINTTEGFILNPASGRVCFPLIKDIVIKDYDGDGVTEYMFGVIEAIFPAIDDVMHYYWFDNVTQEQEVTETSQDLVSSGTGSSHCRASGDFTVGDEPPGRFLTPPLIADLDGTTPNTLEIAYAYMNTDDTFQIVMRNFDGTGRNVEPDIFSADGLIISNMMLMAQQGSDVKNDICVFGHDGNDVTSGSGEVDLLCTNFNTGSTTEYIFDASGTFNISLAYPRWVVIGHAVDYSETNLGGIDSSEVITPWGIMELSDTSQNGSIFLKTLNRIFDPGRGEAAIIPVDYEGIGLDDLIILTDNNLFYQDDGFTDLGAEIQSFNVNPCFDAVWKQNTTVELNIVVADPDAIDKDEVSVNVIAYFGSSNQFQTGFSLNVTSGSTIVRSFIANKTDTSGVVRMQARDTGNPSDIDFKDFNFIVGNAGLEFGDSDCTVDVVTDAEAAVLALTNLTETNTANNAGLNFFTTLDNETGAGFGSFGMFLFAAIIALSMFIGSLIFQKNITEPMLLVPLILIDIVLILFEAVILGIMSGAFIVTIFILLLVVGGIFVSRSFFGNRTM